MRKIWLYILCLIIWIVVVACGYCMIQWHIIQDKTYSYLETYGYTDEDIEQVDLKHSFLNKFLWYNEWRILVEFKKESHIYYWFTYRNHEILKIWISSEPMPDKDKIIEYNNMFENGELKYNSKKYKPEEISPEVVLWDDEENILVTEEKNMNTDNVINLKIWDKTFDVTLEENSATKALVEKLHEWDVIVNAREYWWFEKVGNLGFDLPRADKQIATEPGDLVLYQWNQVSLFYDSNSWSYTKLWKVQMIPKDGLKEILWDWDVTFVFSLLK